MAEGRRSDGGRRGSGDGTECAVELAPGGAAAVGPGVATVDLPFPGYVATAFYRLPQTSWPRRWCLAMITWPYPCCVHFLLPYTERYLYIYIHLYFASEATTGAREPLGRGGHMTPYPQKFTWVVKHCILTQRVFFGTKYFLVQTHTLLLRLYHNYIRPIFYN